MEVWVRSVAASRYILRQMGQGRGSWKASFREPDSPDFSTVFPSIQIKFPLIIVGDPDPHVLGLLDPDPLVRGKDPAPKPFPFSHKCVEIMPAK
jgi:hypothetical protein